MIQSLSKTLTTFLCRKNVIEKDKQEIYRYGYEVFISGMLGFAIVLVLGTLMDRFFESLLFLSIFVPLRRMIGGYHADSYLKCNVIFTIVFLSVIIFSEIMINTISLLYVFILSGIFFWSVLEYAPIENPNKPLDAQQKIQNRKTGILTSACIFVITIAVYFIGHRVSVLMAMTLFSIATLMFVEEFRCSKK